MNGENEIPKKYLPLGTVCWLKNGRKSIMVVGFGGVSAQEKKIYDYMGVMFPEGQLTSDATLMFNHEQVVKVDHIGLSTEESVEFLNKLDTFLNTYRQELIAGLEETNFDSSVDQSESESDKPISNVATEQLMQSISNSSSEQPAQPVQPLTNAQTESISFDDI